MRITRFIIKSLAILFLMFFAYYTVRLAGGLGDDTQRKSTEIRLKELGILVSDLSPSDKALIEDLSTACELDTKPIGKTAATACLRSMVDDKTSESLEMILAEHS